MLRNLALLIAFLFGSPLLADQTQDLKQVIAIQHAELQKQNALINKMNEKLNRYITDDGVWKGQNSGLQGPQGAQGLQGVQGLKGEQGPPGPQGAAGPGNLVSWVINEANSCTTYCTFRGYVCLATTFANWDAGSQAQCSSISPAIKRCLCAQ
jgi:hypothetical protein